VRRGGEHDRRDVDRHLFLEALLSARDALILTHTGFEPVRGEVAPPSVVVSELLDVLAQGLDASSPAELVDSHPLQPWSAAAFAANARRPFDAWTARAASSLARGTDALPAGLARTPLDVELPIGETTLRATVDGLTAALCGPQKELLKRGLRIVLDEVDVALEDREPIEADALIQYQLRSWMHGREFAQEPHALDDVEKRLRGEGRLPPAAAGRLLLDEQVAIVRDLLGDLRENLRGETAAGARVECVVQGRRVSAQLPELRLLDAGALLVWVVPTKAPAHRARLLAWLALRVASLVDGALLPGGARLEGALVAARRQSGSGAQTHFLPVPVSTSEAEAELASMVARALAARSRLLPLFPRLSPALAQAAGDEDATASARILAERGAWEGAFASGGDRDDPYVGALFPLTVDELAQAPFAGKLVSLAEATWGPVLREEEALAKRWWAKAPAKSRRTGRS
jgi:exodeoxyribonuclease V gamma subunit